METNTSSYYEHLSGKYLPGRSLYLSIFFYPKIFKQFSQKPILDLGCGLGEFLKFCKSKNRTAIGIDSNELCVDYCNKIGLNANIDNVVSFNISKFQDCKNIICDNVIEHLDEKTMDVFFQNIISQIDSETNVVIIVPGKKGFKKDPTHKTYVNSETMNNLFKKHNFTIKNMFFHPFNVSFISSVFYLNMQVFVIKKKN